MGLRATLRSLTLASVLSHSDNKRVSGFAQILAYQLGLQIPAGR